jgi:cytidylate kinase
MPTTVAIDGGAYTGTSTAGRLLAERLGLPFLNTGRIYRAGAYEVMRRGGHVDDAEFCRRVTQTTHFNFDELGDVVAVAGRPVSTEELYTPEMGPAASRFSAHPEVRWELLELQRGFAVQHGCVMEGRDIGTTVLPGANHKFFFTCDTEERVRRSELAGRSQTAAQIERRDRDDANHEFGAFVKPPDACVIDTTHIPPKLVVECLAQFIALGHLGLLGAILQRIGR